MDKILADWFSVVFMVGIVVFAYVVFLKPILDDEKREKALKAERDELWKGGNAGTYYISKYSGLCYRGRDLAQYNIFAFVDLDDDQELTNIYND